jgi:hypothetical protein
MAMYEQQQEAWRKSDERKRHWSARRAWIGVAIMFLALVVRHYEHLH